jgi:hypothetical protein
VRNYLAGRMRQLGMAVATEIAPLASKSVERLAAWGDPKAAAVPAVNLIGLLPGRDRTKPALLLMAHHDSVWASPGAADDAAGIATALEVVRAVKTRGAPARDVILLFTDAEELGLNGAKLFFAGHPLAGRVGAVINMEARGGGGRTAMFETGRGNARWVELYRRSAGRPFSNSLGVMVYELMPNNTDFTVPKERGLPGFNFAFVGEAQFYHSPASTPDALDQGSLQDMGDQVLGVTEALAFAPDLPTKASDAVFGDVLGLFVIAYGAHVGWVILLVSAALFGFAGLRLRGSGAFRWKGLAAGAALAFAILLHGALLLRVGNLLSGSGGRSNYYDRLAALPRLEAQAFSLALAVMLLGVALGRAGSPVSAPIAGLVLMFVGIVFEGWSTPILVLGIGATVSATLVWRRPITSWEGWLGLALLLLVFGLALQIAAPVAAPVLQWPLLLASVGAAFAAWKDSALERRGTLMLLVVLAALGAGQLLYLSHFTFLGVGAPIPETMAVYALIAGALLWPLLSNAAPARALVLAAAALTLVAIGVALSVRFDPIADTIPPYSEKR